MGDNDMLSTEFCIEWLQPLANRATLEVGSTSFEGVLHDNLSNKKRQGSGFAPPILKSYPGANLYRDNAVGINFEHICNGAKEQYDISMFTPRQEPCHLKQARENRHELHWPSKGSKWGMKARMVYDLSKEDQVDLVFECTPTVALYSQRFAIMMWASYIHCTHDRKIHFWGTEGDRTGWAAFGEVQEQASKWEPFLMWLFRICPTRKRHRFSTSLSIPRRSSPLLSTTAL